METASIGIRSAPEMLKRAPDWERCRGEIARVLRPGGILSSNTAGAVVAVEAG